MWEEYKQGFGYRDKTVNLNEHFLGLENIHQ